MVRKLRLTRWNHTVLSCGLMVRSPESHLTNPPGHLWRDKWTAVSGSLSHLKWAGYKHTGRGRAERVVGVLQVADGVLGVRKRAPDSGLNPQHWERLGPFETF